MEEEKKEEVAAEEVKKPLYQFHKGSIRVSGKSQVFKTGLSAFHEWRNGTRPIEFVFLGGNAGHQAYKASVVTKREIENVCKIKVAFLPMWSSVVTDSQDGTVGDVKDLSIWRIIELESAEKKPFRPRKKKFKQETVKQEDLNKKSLTKQSILPTLQSALKSTDNRKEI